MSYKMRGISEISRLMDKIVKLMAVVSAAMAFWEEFVATFEGLPDSERKTWRRCAGLAGLLADALHAVGMLEALRRER